MLQWKKYMLDVMKLLVVFGINVMLSWKPLFLSASEYIRIDSLAVRYLMCQYVVVHSAAY